MLPDRLQKQLKLEEVNISEETLDLKWPNKTLNAGMGPKQEVLQIKQEASPY